MIFKIFLIKQYNNLRLIDTIVLSRNQTLYKLSLNKNKKLNKFRLQQNSNLLMILYVLSVICNNKFFYFICVKILLYNVVLSAIWVARCFKHIKTFISGS